MKLTPRSIEGFLNSPPPTVRLILIYGSDKGLVRDRLTRLIGVYLEDPKDPFRLVDMSVSALKSDPTLLSDEAAAVAFGGGTKVIQILGAQDGISKALTSLLDSPPAGAVVLATADELSPRSSLRKLCETQEEAAALPCYDDSPRDTDRVIRERLRGFDLQWDDDVLAFLVDHLGSDRGITLSELEKLKTYLGNRDRLTMADAIACVGNSSQLSQNTLIDAIMRGNGNQAMDIVARLIEDGIGTIAILRGIGRHFQKLHLAIIRKEQGRSASEAVDSLRPPVFFRDKPAMVRHVDQWRKSDIAHALDLLTQAEVDCKSTGLPDSAVSERVILRLVAAAQKFNRP